MNDLFFPSFIVCLFSFISLINCNSYIHIFVFISYMYRWLNTDIRSVLGIDSKGVVIGSESEKAGLGHSSTKPVLLFVNTWISSINNLRKTALTQQWKEQHRSHMTLTPADLLCSVSLSWRFSTTFLVLKVSQFKRGLYVPGKGTKSAKKSATSCCRCPDD